MTPTNNAAASSEAPSQAARNANESSADVDTDRPIPFVVRVATVWTNKADFLAENDGQLSFWQRAPLTGNIVATSGGSDVSFSDLEIK